MAHLPRGRALAAAADRHADGDRTEEWEAVGFNIPVAEFCKVETPVAVGPDLLAVEIDIDECVQRLRVLADAEIAEALLNQRAVSGIGNIWKSETLWACRVSPFARMASVGDEKLREIVVTARKLLRQSVASTSRSRFAVYGRRGEPCRRCGTVIEMRRQGPDARVTYWCPRCQLQ